MTNLRKTTLLLKGRHGAVGLSPHQRAQLFYFSKKLYLFCLELVGSRNRFEPDFTINKNKLKALWMIDLNVK